MSPGQFSDYIVRAGGITNAYTDEDATVYWETVPSTYLPVVLWLEADRMRNLEITGSGIGHGKGSRQRRAARAI